MTEIQKQFDYTSLDVETREFLKVKTAEINFYLSNTVQSAVEAGKRFIEVRELLSNNKQGGFEGWLNQEFGMSRFTAYQFINLAENPSCKKILQLDISKSVAYLLSAPSTPESAVTEAIEKAESGEKLTVKDTKELIDAKKLLREQEEKLEANEKRIRELQKDLLLLREQLPTEDVKKQTEAAKRNCREGWSAWGNEAISEV